MPSTETLQVTMPSDTEVMMTRVFDAPRRMVFDAWTKPELLKRWLGVRNGWTMVVCEVDLHVGGAYRYVWRGPSGDMGMGGVFREVVRPERIVSTEKFDEAWYEGEAIDTLVMVEDRGRTTVTTTVRYASREVRDAVIKSGMASGVAESYDTLAALLASEGRPG
jgi:uncharacterized protein YndB with AHSA1/START domain